MTLNKKRTVRAIGRRTRLKNRDVQIMLEALIDLWTEELVSGGRIELEHFLVLTVRARPQMNEPRLICHASRTLKQRIADQR